MPDQASRVTPLTISCQPSTNSPGAPSGNGCCCEPGPTRGPGVAVADGGRAAGAEAAVGSTKGANVGDVAALEVDVAGAGLVFEAGGGGFGATAGTASE